jgi:hypothetical protein
MHSYFKQICIERIKKNSHFKCQEKGLLTKEEKSSLPGSPPGGASNTKGTRRPPLPGTNIPVSIVGFWRNAAVHSLIPSTLVSTSTLLLAEKPRIERNANDWEIKQLLVYHRRSLDSIQYTCIIYIQYPSIVPYLKPQNIVLSFKIFDRLYYDVVVVKRSNAVHYYHVQRSTFSLFLFL